MKTIALHILDIAQNSIRASASLIKIEIFQSEKTDTIKLIITDNGSGMDDKVLEQADNPFFTSRSTRKIGLGISLLQQQAQLANGGLSLSSEKGRGTILTSWFSYSHPDRQPLGDLGGVLTILIGANPGIDFLYSHYTDTGSFQLDTEEIRKYLGTENLSGYNLQCGLREMIYENLVDIGVSELEYTT